MPRSIVTVLVPLAAMLLGLPLLGVALSGRDLEPYLELPPVPVAVEHAPFSWLAFLALAGLIAACAFPFLHRVLVSRSPRRTAPGAGRSLPWWGWLGAVALVAAWALAWSRFSWFAPLQRYTFSPIWLGYIVLVNALTWRRAGRSMLTDRPWRLIALFPLSAVFWWLFEFLNRFVQNWHYVGGEALEPWPYVLQATLPFSTVLPAVLSTRDWLATFPALHAGLERAWTVPRVAPRAVAAVSLVVAGAALVGIGFWPEQLYALVWIAPLLALLALQALSGRATILAPLARGDWSGLWQAALAALVCGFLWELWNVRSLAHWEYSIPYVHRFEIFHMPLLGYAGYLPFGLECVAAASLIERE